MRIIWGVFFAATLLVFPAAAGAAATDRPNALDRHVDSLSDSVLLAQPATQLVDPARQRAALRRAHWTLPGWFVILLCQSAALFYLWSSGGAATLRDWLRRRIASAWMVRFAFGAALALVARLASFLPAFYLYRVARTMQIDLELTRWWLVSWAVHTLLGMIVAGLIAAIVLGWVERTHQWYLYTIAAILAGCVIWAYAAPYVALPAARAVPLSGALAQQTHAVLARAGFPAVPVKVVHIRNSPVGDAAVLGIGSARTILLSDKLVDGSTPAELVYEVAVQIAHVAHRDFLAIALIEGGIVIVFSAIAVVLADRIRFRRDDDPLSRLAIVGALLALVYIVAIPVRNGALRSYVFSADRSAVALTGDPAAAVRALVRATDQHMEEVCPESSAALFLYTDPGTGARVAAINHVPSGCP
ncbi:MAG TPA: M48 family metalloprotease [Candidatus Cybelea sp.]|jgi:Zn-dependent protease with chaperone function